MGGIAGIIYWDKQSVPLEYIRHMASRLRHRGPDGVNWCISGQAGLIQCQFALNHRERAHTQPVWLPDGSLAIVSDVRLDNRLELISQIKSETWMDDPPSDAALILAAYLRWGKALPEKLAGDFSFLIWDVHNQEVFAARDAFGVRPFLYLWCPRGFYFASEAKAILGLPSIPVKMHDRAAIKFLLNEFPNRNETFFSEIHHLEPGHYLSGDMLGARQEPWWTPDPDRQLHLASTEEYYLGFRQELQAAVARRLQVNVPVAFAMSGGLDSTSLVILAAELTRRGEVGTSSIETISALYPDLSCDESSRIQSVNRQVPFPNRTIFPLDHRFMVEDYVNELWWVEKPFIGTIPGYKAGIKNRMMQHGMQLLIDGDCGDELVFERYYLDDLVRTQRYLRLLPNAWKMRDYTWIPISRLLYRAVLHKIPSSIKHLYHKIERKLKDKNTFQHLPDWLEISRKSDIMSVEDDWNTGDPNFHSLTQQGIYDNFTHPETQMFLEVWDYIGAQGGFIHASPYCDRQLVEFVMAIPFEHRLTNGPLKYLTRRAMQDDLPREVLCQSRSVAYDQAIALIFEQVKPLLYETLFSSHGWASQDYIRRSGVEDLYRAYEFQKSPNDDRHLTRPLWKISSLELWMRSFSRYSIIDSNL